MKKACFFQQNFQIILIETIHRKKYLIVSSDKESNTYDIINKESDIDGNNLSRTVVGFTDDWIESLMDKWKEFVEDFSDKGENVKDTNRTVADFIDDLIKSLFDSWGEYVDEFSGSDDREVGCCLGYQKSLKCYNKLNNLGGSQQR